MGKSKSKLITRTVNTLKELTADASSGGDVKYIGNPEQVNKNSSSSGSVKKQ